MQRTHKIKARKYLTEEEVRQIRKLASEGTQQKHIAIRFGVSDACISLIVNGKRHAAS